LGDVLSRLGDGDGALAAYQRVAQLRPQDASAQRELGDALLATGDYAAAVPALKRAVALDPDCGPAHLSLGTLAAETGDAMIAVPHLIAAGMAQQSAAATMLVAAARLEEIGASSDALRVLREAARRQPSNADVHDSLGALLHRLGQLPEALDSYERALAIDERRAQTWVHSGLALESMGALGRAITAFEEAMTIKPADPQCVASIASCAYRLCDWDLVDRMTAALREQPHGIDHLPAFLLNAADFGAAEVAASLRRRASAAHWPPAPEHPGGWPAAGHAPLRVAYVSPDFRAHPVAYAISGVIEHHDRARVIPIAISLKAPDGSAAAARLAGAFAEFIDASTLSDRSIVQLMREREIDVAIDLAGLTTGGRSSIFAMRSAPLQINFLGYPGSTGIPFMDYIVADSQVLPESDEVYFSERVLRMPHCYLPFDDSRIVASAGEDARLKNGLPPDGLVFCAFTNGYKITRSMFQVWMALLRDVPDSVLWLRSMGAATAVNLKNTAAQLDIDPGRLVFAAYLEDMDSISRDCSARICSWIPRPITHTPPPPRRSGPECRSLPAPDMASQEESARACSPPAACRNWSAPILPAITALLSTLHERRRCAELASEVAAKPGLGARTRHSPLHARF
jgi:protein O-GlcNAc transferase